MALGQAEHRLEKVKKRCVITRVLLLGLFYINRDYHHDVMEPDILHIFPSSNLRMILIFISH